MNARVVFARWLVANVLGFVVGSLLGASNDGLIVAMLPRRPALILGDLVFGAAIGAAQWLALRDSGSRSIPPRWILATSVGFVVGARSGTRLASELVAVVPLPLSAAFGICVGASIGLATAWVMRDRLKPSLAFMWVALNVLAWVVGEGIAFSAGFSQAFVAFLALAIASVTWIGLELVHRKTVLPSG
ncbi:MAG: hypothetical protein ABMA15_04095 [Vicinamibacterales bacterium]